MICSNCLAGIHRSCRPYANCTCKCAPTVPDVVKEAERIVRAALDAEVYDQLLMEDVRGDEE